MRERSGIEKWEREVRERSEGKQRLFGTAHAAERGRRRRAVAGVADQQKMFHNGWPAPDDYFRRALPKSVWDEEPNDDDSVHIGEGGRGGGTRISRVFVQCS